VNDPIGGAPFQQQQNFPPFGNQQMSMGNDVSGDEKLFRLSLISFCSIGFWFLIHLMNRFVMDEMMYRFRLIFDLIGVATSSAILIFALAWYKQGTKKPILIVFLIVGILMCLIDKFTNGYYL
jgi:hypothetical protein